MHRFTDENGTDYTITTDATTLYLNERYVRYEIESVDFWGDTLTLNVPDRSNPTITVCGDDKTTHDFIHHFDRDIFASHGVAFRTPGNMYVRLIRDFGSTKPLRLDFVGWNLTVDYCWVDNRSTIPFVGVKTTQGFYYPSAADSLAVAEWLVKWAGGYTQVINPSEHDLEAKYTGEQAQEIEMEGLPVSYAKLFEATIPLPEFPAISTRTCELCGCSIASTATLCTACSMADELVDDMKSIVTATADRIETKYRKGAKEHGGRGWEMGTAKLIANAQDEVADLTCYLTWLDQHLDTVNEMASNALANLANYSDGGMLAVNNAREELVALLDLLEGKPNRV